MSFPHPEFPFPRSTPKARQNIDADTLWVIRASLDIVIALWPRFTHDKGPLPPPKTERVDDAYEDHYDMFEQ